tara:strand:+ start:87 stop:299 length:213 start_codon:yes stop_codon:yes gene_type:complete
MCILVLFSIQQKEYEMRVLATLTAFLGCLFLFGAVFGHGDLGEPVVRVLFGMNAFLFLFWSPFIWSLGNE